MLLPAGADSTLVSLVSTDTLSNKTLTAPKFADAGFIADANGNEMIVFQTTTSAENALRQNQKPIKRSIIKIISIKNDLKG